MADKPNLEEFGRQLRAARKAKELSLDDLAERTKMAGFKAGKAMLGFYETAKPHSDNGRPRQPPYDLVVFLARQLDKPPQPWLDLTGYPCAERVPKAALSIALTLGPNERKLVEYYREMSGVMRERGLELFRKAAAGEIGNLDED